VLRENLAACFRAHGIEALATPRSARGVVQRPEVSRTLWLRRRKDQIGEPRVLQSARAAAEVEARLDGSPQRPWEVVIERRQRAMREAYKSIAEVLEHSADPNDQELGRKVRVFVSEMPPIRTRHQERVEMLRADRDAQALKAALERHDREQGLTRIR